MIVTLPTRAAFTHDLHCPACGRVWARLPGARPAAEFYPFRRHCADCGAARWSEYRHPAGSLWFFTTFPSSESGFSHLSRDLLLRELDLDEREARRMSLQWDGNAAIIDPSIPQESPVDPQAMLRIMALRTKAENGDITDDELREAVRTLREGRTQAARAPRPSAAPKAKISGADVLALFAPKPTT